MNRTALGVSIGVAIALVVTLALELVGNYVFPPTPVLNLAGDAEIAAVMRSLPAGAFVPTLLAAFVGVFLGCWGALNFVEVEAPWPAWAVAGAVGVYLLIKVILLPHPLWFLLVGLAGVGAIGYGLGWLRMRPAFLHGAEDDGVLDVE